MDSWIAAGLKGVGLAVIVTGTGAVSAQISPGPLSRAHAHLEGARECFACHGAGRGESSMDAQCTDCHVEIGWQIRRSLGLHGQGGERDCSSCHPDHAGRDFELIAWDEGDAARFDHGRTGWSLEGRHAPLDCAACHRPSFQTGAVMPLLRRRNSERSWLGLERACLSCHADYHRGTLDASCETCHATDAWSPATAFDHSAAAFPLDGRHAEVACDKCHRVSGRVFLEGDGGIPLPRYKPVPHADCAACHADPHRNKLGATCAACHVTAGFDQVARAAFDHSGTRFALRGAHARVKCAACHDNGRRQPPHERCASCHADPHAGQATREGRQVDCASCHDERSFDGSTFTAADHARTRYPLEGRHQGVRCARCHVKDPSGVPREQLGPARVWLRPRSERCGDCHADAHGGQLASHPGAGACAGCHSVKGWKPTTFTATEHATLKLPLRGAHATAACAACHGPARPGLPELPAKSTLGSAGVILVGLEADCAACHPDPHQRPLAGGCAACHSADRFRPSTVDADLHRRFAYALEGAHRAVSCADCHAELLEQPSGVHLREASGTRRVLRFEIPQRLCASCHATPHGEQFAGRGADCGACHGFAGFSPASHFDHDRDSRFSLAGGHRAVACSACHRTGASGPVVYRGTPRDCRACHGAEKARRLEGR